MVEELLKQMTSINDAHLSENKIQMKHTVLALHTQFKERAERIFRKIYHMEYLTNLSTKLKTLQTSEEFFAYLREAVVEVDTLMQRLSKGVEFMKANIEDNHDEEVIYQRMGARAMHCILSG